MGKFVGGTAALVALIAGLISHVDPVTCLERATLAFMLGWVSGQVWHLMIGATATRPGMDEMVALGSGHAESGPDHTGDK